MNSLPKVLDLESQPSRVSQRPTNWKVMKIGDVVDINPRPEKGELDDETFVSFIPMKCVEEESGKFDPLENRKVSEVRKGYTPFRDGDVLFAKVTPCMENGKGAVLKGLTNGLGFGSTEFFALRPKNGLAADYLFHFIMQRTFRKDAERNMTGAVGLRRVPKAYLAQQSIPLPPLDEQRRIVAEIEKQFTRLEVGVAALRSIQTKLKRYRAAVLKTACEGGDWKKVDLGDVVLSMKNGIYKPRSAYADEGVACLRMYNIENGKIVWKSIKRMKLTKKDIDEYHLSPGDLLVNRVNSRELVGKAAPIPEGLELCVFESKNIRLRLKRKLADPKFVGFAMAIYGQAHFNRNAQQVVGMASISQPQVAALQIPMPPLAEQKRIVAEVDRRLSVVEELEALVSSNLQRATRLRQSILQKAFSGAL